MAEGSGRWRLFGRGSRYLAEVKKAEDECAKQMAEQWSRGTVESREKDSALDHVNGGHQPEAETAQQGNRGIRGYEEAAE